MVSPRPYLPRYGPLALCDVQDTKCVMWATLALDALCRHAVQLDGENIPCSPFGYAVVAIFEAYTIPSLRAEGPIDTRAHPFPWLTHDITLHRSMIQDLFSACEVFYPVSVSDAEHGSPTFYCYLFYSLCYANHEYLPTHLSTNDPKTSGISQLMRELNERPITRMLDKVKFLLNWQHTEASFTGAAIDRAIDICVDEVCLNIQEYVQEKLETPQSPDVVLSAHDPYRFRECIDIVRFAIAGDIERFLVSLGTGLGTVSADESNWNGIFDKRRLADEGMVRRELMALYEDLTDNFTHLSPLLEAFRYTYDKVEDVAEHVAAHDFELYTDNDWFTQELDLVEDLEDVLHGPEHTTKEEVSDLLELSDPSSPPCDICGDVDTTMRKLKACQHLMCEACLTTQLDSQHACRYKCPFCRAVFFPSA